MLRLRDLHGAHDSRESCLITHQAWRLRLVTTLLWASALLTRLACRLQRLHRGGRRGKPELEFYSEAAAPEGALYVDGHLLGTLPGVTRL
ncbi:hypothetical protein [Paucibacter sp. KCTC 42545]|uniref:hypothetical protein n=1 Tax=Paucibacter sp. KCTC 42545 TaxID=1768242 RepID=UPI0012E3792A|nr:hypothetical protein [Paucibacter sp. KCTC 42545]